MGFVRGIVGIALAILFAVFAVANRQSVDVVWSPVHPPAHLPVYLIALSMLALGFLLGSFMAWLNALPVRIEKTKQGRHIKKLEKELGVLKESQGQEDKTMLQELTALPAKLKTEIT